MNDVNPVLRVLRQAIDESGWKHAALAEELAVKPQYLSMMLAGEKPWTARHQDALPDDVEAIFARLYAETFGLIVVAPVEGEQAVRHLVGGLFGLLAPRLPVRASRMAKCTLTENEP